MLNASFQLELADGIMVNLSIPRALSKPVHLHNVVCSSTDLNLLDCSFSKYSGHVNDVHFATIACHLCKYYYGLCKLNKH